MAVVTQVLEDGEKNFTIRLTETNSSTTNTIAISSVAANTLFGAPVRLRLDAIKWNTNALITLDWDATADVRFLNLTVGQENWDFRKEGGINNNAGAGITGDILVTPTTPTDYDLTLWFTKKFS